MVLCTLLFHRYDAFLGAAAFFVTDERGGDALAVTAPSAVPDPRTDTDAVGDSPTFLEGVLSADESGAPQQRGRLVLLLSLENAEVLAC